MAFARIFARLRTGVVALALAGTGLACGAQPRIESFVTVPDRWDDRTRQEITYWIAAHWLREYSHLLREQDPGLTSDDVARLEVGVKQTHVAGQREELQLVCSAVPPNDEKARRLLTGCQRIVTDAINQVGPEIAREVASRLR